MLKFKCKKRQFRVSNANTFDDPVGGLINNLLIEDGQHFQHTGINDGRALLIDIGGFTTDWLAVNPGGEVDYSLATSVPIGIQSVIANYCAGSRFDLGLAYVES